VERYSSFLPLHELWNGYITQLLVKADANAASKLSRADLHGAKLVVVRSRSPTLVGQKGIVVKETENTVELIDEGNSVKSECIFRFVTFHGANSFSIPAIPKADSVFRLELPIPPGSALLYGDQLRSRPAERSSRKPKVPKRGTIDL
jgi:RNase P/RNase MRP subunit p29